MACFACTPKNLPEEWSASLLLNEVHGFMLGVIAEILGASENQIRNRLQEARSTMTAVYDSTCALIRKQGVCHQCVELDGVTGAGMGSPLAVGPDATAVRTAIVRQSAAHGWGPWHRKHFELLDEVRQLEHGPTTDRYAA